MYYDGFPHSLLKPVPLQHSAVLDKHNYYVLLTLEDLSSSGFLKVLFDEWEVTSF